MTTVNCVICLDSPQSAQIWKTDCGHPVCEPCANESLSRSEQCAYCRQSDPFPEQRSQYEELVEKVRDLRPNDIFSDNGNVREIRNLIRAGRPVTYGRETVLGHLIEKIAGMNRAFLIYHPHWFRGQKACRTSDLVRFILDAGANPLHGLPVDNTPLRAALGAPAPIFDLLCDNLKECTLAFEKINAIFFMIAAKRGKFTGYDVQLVRALTKQYYAPLARNSQGVTIKQYVARNPHRNASQAKIMELLEQASGRAASQSQGLHLLLPQ